MFDFNKNELIKAVEAINDSFCICRFLNNLPRDKANMIADAINSDSEWVKFYWDNEKKEWYWE